MFAAVIKFVYSVCVGSFPPAWISITMRKTISLTSTQLDQANISLDRVTAILELVSDCGNDDAAQDRQITRAVFIVADIAREEINKVRVLLNPLDSDLNNKDPLCRR